MDNNHPIQPSPELIQQWIIEGRHQDYCSAYDYAIAQSAQWGADQELEECDAMVARLGEMSTGFLTSLRRKSTPPSLKKQAYIAACDALDTYIYGEPDPKDKKRAYNTIRSALEELPND